MAKITFTDASGYDVIISPQKKSALEQMCSRNNHTEVRIKLAELFKCPTEIKQAFKGIQKIAKKQGFLTYEDAHIRLNWTQRMIDYINRRYGLEAVDFAYSVM